MANNFDQTGFFFINTYSKLETLENPKHRKNVTKGVDGNF